MSLMQELIGVSLFARADRLFFSLQELVGVSFFAGADRGVIVFRS